MNKMYRDQLALGESGVEFVNRKPHPLARFLLVAMVLITVGLIFFVFTFQTEEVIKTKAQWLTHSNLPTVQARVPVRFDSMIDVGQGMMVRTQSNEKKVFAKVTKKNLVRLQNGEDELELQLEFQSGQLNGDRSKELDINISLPAQKISKQLLQTFLPSH